MTHYTVLTVLFTFLILFITIVKLVFANDSQQFHWIMRHWQREVCEREGKSVGAVKLVFSSCSLHFACSAVGGWFHLLIIARNFHAAPTLTTKSGSTKITIDSRSGIESCLYMGVQLHSSVGWLNKKHNNLLVAYGVGFSGSHFTVKKVSFMYIDFLYGHIGFRLCRGICMHCDGIFRVKHMRTGHFLFHFPGVCPFPSEALGLTQHSNNNPLL